HRHTSVRLGFPDVPHPASPLGRTTGGEIDTAKAFPRVRGRWTGCKGSAARSASVDRRPMRRHLLGLWLGVSIALTASAAWAASEIWLPNGTAPDPLTSAPQH